MLVSCLACCFSPDGGFFILWLPFIGSIIDHCRSRCKGEKAHPLYIHTYHGTSRRYIPTRWNISYPPVWEPQILQTFQCFILNIHTFYRFLSINIYQEFTSVQAFWELHSVLLYTVPFQNILPPSPKGWPNYRSHSLTVENSWSSLHHFCHRKFWVLYFEQSTFSLVKALGICA
jgi:hypothetical protein